MSGDLLEKLARGEVRPRVIQDCVRLIDDEVASKRGLLAVPLKAGYKVLQGFRPGFIAQCVDFLLDEFCGALDPFYREWRGQDPATRPSLQQALLRDPSRVADSLLGVTDRRAARSTNTAIKKLYDKLRGAAKSHVEAALPGLARTIEPYLR